MAAPSCCAGSECAREGRGAAVRRLPLAPCSAVPRVAAAAGHAPREPSHPSLLWPAPAGAARWSASCASIWASCRWRTAQSRRAGGWARRMAREGGPGRGPGQGWTRRTRPDRPLPSCPPRSLARFNPPPSRYLYILDGALTTYTADEGGLDGGRAPVPPCILKVGPGKTQVRAGGRAWRGWVAGLREPCRESRPLEPCHLICPPCLLAACLAGLLACLLACLLA